MEGCIHIYCGDGKGKTTAAVGLAVRAAGRGKKIVMVRFLKTDDSGEVAVLNSIAGIEVFPCEKSFGFSWNMTEEQKKEAKHYYSSLLKRVWQEAVEIQADMLILDEVVGACNQSFVDDISLLELLRSRPKSLEIVMTGRNPSQALVEIADYVTEMRAVRHPFEKGLAAREGIEY